MIIELNIGLKIDATNEIIPASVALAVVKSSGGIRVLNHRLDQSATEPTLILCCEIETQNGHAVNHLDAADIIANTLQQDCIAIRYPDGSGLLRGQKAADWGCFNPDYFIRF